NPFFPKVLEAEKDNDLAPGKSMDIYNWKWEGICKQVLEGSIYADEMRAAQIENRICSVSVVRGIPVNTYWDLGRSDLTAIWFIQRVGMEWRVVDYYENAGKHIDHYMHELQKRGYVYGTHHLPHDAENQYVGQKNTVEQQVRAFNMGAVRIVRRPLKK